IREIGIVRLWKSLDGLNDDETVDLLNDLAARALLDYHTTEGTEGKSRGTAAAAARAVVLHDLLREFMAAGLGDGRIAAHEALLAAYRATCTSVGWHNAPDDGYLYDHLVYHLDATGATDELKGLFADQGWMHARVPQSGYIYDGYLADLGVAWMHADA